MENLGGITSQIAWLALDAAALRHDITAHNIANSETPGFVPKRVEFAEQLRALVQDAIAGADPQDLGSRFAELKSKMQNGSFVTAKTDQLVEVDMEMINLTENVLHYRAILEGLSKRSDVLRMAIRERSS